MGDVELGPADHPGQFAFADGDRLDHILATAGFRAADRQALILPVRIADVDDVVSYRGGLPAAATSTSGSSPQ